MDERRMICPSCGSRPRRMSRVLRNGELVEETLWCHKCVSLLEWMPARVLRPKVDFRLRLVPLASDRPN